jgi:error-prone DNA polymerase
MGFYPPHVLTNDAKRHGMAINRPDINSSSINCTVNCRTEGDSNTIDIGIGYVRGIGETLASQIITERERAGPYITLFQFIQRTALPIEVVLNLIQVGAFDSFGLNRRQLIWHMGLFQGKALSTYIDSNGISNHQLQLSFQEPITDIDFEDFNRFEKMVADYRLLNLSPDSHPMEFFRSMQPNQFISSCDLASKSLTTPVEVIGLLVCRQRPSTANGVVFLLLEDEFGVINALLRPAIVDKYNLVINTAVFLRIAGTLEGNINQSRMIIVDEITPMRFDTPSMGAALNLRTKSWN